MGPILLLAGCTDGPKLPIDTAAFVVRPGVVVVNRDGAEPSVDARTWIAGSSSTSPDAAGHVYYLDLPPGRSPVYSRWDGHATAHAAPSILPEQLSAATLTPHPVTLEELDPTAEAVVSGDGFTVTIPAGVVVQDEVPLAAPYTLGHDRLDASERLAQPGDLVGLSNDVDLAPIVLDEIVALRGYTELGDVAIAEEVVLPVTFSIPAGSPLRTEGAVVKVFVWSSSRGYWVRSGTPTIDAAGVATFEIGSFTWFALGREEVPRGCVSGRLVGEGGPVAGAEVKLLQDGVVMVDRVTAGEDGAFCLPIDPGATGALHAVGFSVDRAWMYTWTGGVVGASEGSCLPVSGCVDVGEIEASTWADADEDLFWAGPGGDCDDLNPAVSPNPTLGDGSWCGSAL